MGELGTRLLFEGALGVGTAYGAAAGWDGDAYVIYGKNVKRRRGGAAKSAEANGAAPTDEEKWWFCWETAWDSAGDAEEFAAAWVTLWRSNSRDRRLGSLRAAKQEFQAGDWHVGLERVVNRVVVVWYNNGEVDAPKVP